MDDLALMAALAGDLDAAFPAFVRAHQDGVYALARRSGAGDGEAAGLTRETFVAAYRVLGRIPPPDVEALAARPFLAGLMEATVGRPPRRRPPRGPAQAGPGAPRRRGAAPAGFCREVLEAVGLVDRYAAVDGRVGRLFTAWNGRGVSLVTLTGDEAVFAARYAAHHDRPLRAASRPPAALRRALETGRIPASLRLDLDHLRPFHRAVLEATSRIPYGEVRDYAWVAQEAGNPAAVRAAGTALGRNPLPFLVPCHRVIRSDGTAGHYGYGTETKRALLRAEGVDVPLHRGR